MAEMVISHALSRVLNLARFDFRTVTIKTLQRRILLTKIQHIGICPKTHYFRSQRVVERDYSRRS
jgi:hypothetical protein